MKRVNKLIAMAMIVNVCFAVGNVVQATAEVKANKYSAETMKSDNKDITYRWCDYLADCEDNCVENGFSILIKDQDGETYVMDKEYSDESYVGAKFLVVTKYSEKNVISAYQITDKGLKLLACPPYHLGGAQ